MAALEQEKRPLAHHKWTTLTFIKAQLHPMTDPRWIEPIYSNVDGQDFLGLRLVQERIVGHLLPGIITITPRARYYAFYSWLLVEYAQQHPAGWSFNHFIRQREQIFGLANIAYGGAVAGLAGSQTFSGHWQTYAEQADIPLTVENYLQAIRRGYGLYAGVMRTLGLVNEHEDGQGWEVTAQGQALAAAFAQAIAHTAYYRQRHRYDEAASIETAVLREYGACCSLDNLAGQADHLPALELLIALDAPLEPDPRSPDASRVGNMRGTLGLLLDMQQQSQQPLSEGLFRRHSLLLAAPLQALLGGTECRLNAFTWTLSSPAGILDTPRTIAPFFDHLHGA